MYIRNLKKAFSISFIALMFVFAAVGAANAQNDRFRVKHGNYRTDQQGVDVLQQAINEGYRQGFQVGQQDRSNRRRSNWKKNNIYRSGEMGYNSHVDRSQYQYYFQQGFQRLSLIHISEPTRPY